MMKYQEIRIREIKINKIYRLINHMYNNRTQDLKRKHNRFNINKIMPIPNNNNKIYKDFK